MNAKLPIVGCLLAGTILITGFSAMDDQAGWTVPEKYDKMANPVAGKADATANGKSLWAKHCQSCHGKTGKGDGSKAANLKTHPGDFTAAAFQGQSDGSIFYKTAEGKGDMPSFKKKLPDENDIWGIVNYLRTLK